VALRLVGNLWRYWLQSGRLSEGRMLVAKALALPGADAPTAARCQALDAAGGIEYWSADSPAAHAWYEAELDLARRTGERWNEAMAWFNLFYTYGDRGELDRAIEAKQTSEAILRDLGDHFGLLRVEQATFLVMLAQGALDPVHVEALAARSESSGDPWLARLAPTVRAYLAFMGGDVAVAARLLAQATRGSMAVREMTDAALGTQFYVVAAPMIGQAESGAVIHGACQAAFERLGIRPPASYQDLAGTDPIPLIEAQLGPEVFAAAVERGRRMSIEEAVDLIDEVTAGLG
jgi:hypothetical protein